jgi:hypothetical protein
MKHKRLEKIVNWTLAVMAIIFVVVICSSSIIHWIETEPNEGKLDLSDIMKSGSNVQGVTVFKGIAAFKYMIETLNATTGPISSRLYGVNVTLSLHRVYYDFGFDVSHVTINSTMYNPATDCFVITEEIYMEGFQYYSPSEANIQQ